MGAMSRFASLIAWRKKTLPRGLTPPQLAILLSVEGVEKRGLKVPDKLYKDLVAFRKLRQDARVVAIRNSSNGKPEKEKPKPSPAKEVSTIIAVYGYVSQRFDSAKDAEEWLRDRLGRGTVPRGFVVQGKVKTVEKIFKK
jgi:hypothetical protein